MKITPRHLRIALAAAGTVLVGAAAVAITASAAGLRLGTTAAATAASPSPSPGAGAKGAAACQAYLGHLASQLNVSQAKLDAAAIAAAKATIEDSVKSGALTRAQADKIEARLPTAGVCAALGARLASHGRGAAPAGVARTAYLAAAASALGVTSDQLKQDRSGGETLSQVAAAQGVSEDQFKSRLVAALKPALDAAVASGKLKQAREDAILGRLQSGDPPLWSSAPPKGS